ncbi:hypothetical protein [Polyangium jinanense]|uniref:Uncharacterized protein n=1 Tax=Polyangium jinanense TaxID=2829994 RepID=A0A9X3XF60_9BACT|nr:hypothetical protein [Polyangium jinanense]MDC3962865.1 hypothetical protein [Polyangium jinanense]MDC3989249.1 hypothetical protein [Polyangium jinanense]
MKKQENHDARLHYYPDGRIMVEVPHEIDGRTAFLVFLQERPDLHFAGFFHDVPTDRPGLLRREKIAPGDVPNSDNVRNRARTIAGRAIAQGPLQRLIRAVVRCFYGGADYWHCLNDCHGLRDVEIKADDPPPSSGPISGAPQSGPVSTPPPTDRSAPGVPSSARRPSR